MITLPVTPSDDNKAIFVFKIQTPNDYYYISSEETDIIGETVDAQTLRFGDASIIQSLAPAIIGGGTIDYSNNFDLTIVSSPNALSTSFFNAFYPNTTLSLQGAYVTVYIAWKGITTSIADLVRLWEGMIVSYSYDDAINISIERTSIFINSKLPVYKTQSDMDNAISYTDTIETTELGVILPLVYGIFQPHLLIDANPSSSDFWINKSPIYIPRDSAVPTVAMDIDKTIVKVCSHATLSLGTENVNKVRPVVYDDALSQYIFVDSYDSVTQLINTERMFKVNGSGFIFPKADNKLAFVGATNYLHTLEGEYFYGTVAVEFPKINKVTGFLEDVILPDADVLAIQYNKGNNVAKNYSFDSNFGSKVIIGVHYANTSGTVPTIGIKVNDARSRQLIGTGSISIFNTTPPYYGYYGYELSADLEPSYTVGMFKFDADLDSVNTDKAISLTDNVITLTSPSGMSNITIKNLVVRIENILLGGDFTKYIIRDNVVRKYATKYNFNISAKNYMGREVPRDLFIKKAIDAGDISSLFAYTNGRIFNDRSTDITEHDNYILNRGNGYILDPVAGYMINPIITNPVYVMESLLREEAFKLVDLKIASYYYDETTPTDKTMYIYIEELPYANIENYYKDATLGIPNVEKEYKILSFTTTPNLESGLKNVLEIYDIDSSVISASAGIADALTPYVYINDINSNIDTDSFDYLGNKTDGLMKDWLVRKSITSEGDTNSILSKLAFETFTLLVERNSGLSLVSIIEYSYIDTFSKPLIQNGNSLITLSLTPLSSVYTNIILNYNFDAGSGNFIKTIQKTIYNSSALYLAGKTFGIKNTYTYDSEWHYDDTTANKFMSQLVGWFSVNHTIITYIGELKTHIKYEIGDKVKINYPSKIPTSMNNSTIFIIIGKELSQFPVPSIKFTLVDIPDIYYNIDPATIDDIDVWYKADVTIADIAGNHIEWTDSIAPTSLRMLKTGSALGGTLYDVNALTVLETDDTVNTNLAVLEGSGFYNPFQSKPIFTAVHVVKPKTDVTSVWCGGVWDLTGGAGKAFWGIRWGFDATGHFVVTTKYLLGGATQTFTSTSTHSIGEIGILIFQYEESTNTFTIIYKGEKLATIVAGWGLSGGYPQ